MLNKDGYATLAHIYDTAVNPGRWRRALDGVALAVDGKAIALRIRTPDIKSKDQNLLNSTYLRFSRSMAGIYYGMRHSRLQEPDWDFLSRQPLHQPVPDTDMGQDTDDLDRRADYAFLRRKIGVGRRLGIRLNNDQVWFDAMSIAFDTRHISIPNAALPQIYELLPHLTKSVELGRTFSQLKAQYRAALGALDHVTVGLAVALPGGDVIVENKEARRYFDQTDGLSRPASGRLVCDDADQTAQLSRAITAAADTARGEAQTSESLIAVTRRSGRAPLLVDVAPLKDSAAELDTNLVGALITIIDPEQAPSLKLDRFALLHGLTPAETEVCALLVGGHAATDIAEIRNTSPVTVKNQIAAILQKAGITRRTELIRLIVRVLPPID